jgi:hypothetical protein
MVRSAKPVRKQKSNASHDIGRARPSGQLSPIDQFMALSDFEKEAIFLGFDRPIDEAQTREMTAAERRRWEKAKRTRGRPKIGKGTIAVSLTIEKELLRWIDSYAREKHLSRARLVGIALESFRENVGRYQRISDAYDKQLHGAWNGARKSTTSRLHR